MIVLFSPFIAIGMVIFAIVYFSRKKKPEYKGPVKQPPPNVYVQVIVKDGETIKVTTQTPNT